MASELLILLFGTFSHGSAVSMRLAWSKEVAGVDELTRSLPETPVDHAKRSADMYLREWML